VREESWKSGRGVEWERCQLVAVAKVGTQRPAQVTGMKAPTCEAVPIGQRRSDKQLMEEVLRFSVRNEQ
jgi:hypothetical protein